MNTKKILSAAVMGALMGSSILPSISSAKIAVWAPQIFPSSYDDSYSSSKKIKSFLAWEKKILAYMSKDYNSVVIKLKNANAKKAYATEYVSIAKDIAAVFSDAKYSSDYMLPSHMASLKKEIKTYKEFRKEIVSLNGSKINPFLIPAEEITSVENDIIDLQKTVTVSIRKALESYDTSDFKETGKMTINAESSFGKIDMTIEKYTRILSLLTKSQEADIVAKAKFTLNMPGSYEYDEETGDYTKTKWSTVNGDLNIDASVKMIDQDIYLSLKDYTLTTNLKGKEKADFEKSMNELAQYKGKTIKIPLSKSGINTTSLNQAEMISQIKKTLDILDTKSLFTPYKKINDISTLTLKNETIQSIGSVYGQKIKVSDITKVKKEMRKVPLLHTTADGRKTLFIRINEADAIGVASLTKKDIGYSFLVDMKNPKKSTESVHILMEPGLVEAKILAPQVNMDLSYKNKNLVFTGEAYMQNLKIEWPFSEEDSNLIFSFNGKKVGNTTWKKVADTYTYDILFEMTIEEILSKFHMSGESTITKGTFPIVAPKDAIEWKNPLAELARDSQRISDLMSIQLWLEQYYQDYTEYPTKLDKISMYAGKVNEDPKKWQTINGCTFWYIYKVLPDRSGIKNWAYTLTTCLEDKDNIERKAKNDGGTDPLRWEVTSY